MYEFPSNPKQNDSQIKRPKRFMGIKMMLFSKIILPLIIGILITVFVTMFLIYLFSPIWIENSSNAQFELFINFYLSRLQFPCRIQGRCQRNL